MLLPKNRKDAVIELENSLKKLENTSYRSIDKLMRHIMKKKDITAKELHNDFVNKHKKTPDEWIKELKEETKSGDQGLHDWFNKSKSSNGTKGWVQLGGKYGGKPCARQPGQTSTPKCGSSKMKKNLSKDQETIAFRRKNLQDPNQPEKTGAAKPTNVRTEQMNLQEVKDKPVKGSGKKDACYYKVKSKYDVWPSAYASGALVKCRKAGAKNWGTKKESKNYLEYELSEYITENKRYCPKCQKDETRDECKYGVKYWDMFSLPPKLSDTLTGNQLKYNVATVHPGNFTEERDHEYSMTRAEISKIISAANRLRKKVKKGEGNIEAWVQSKITKAADYIDTAADYMDSNESKLKEETLSEKCWKGYKKKGMKKKGNRLVPNCVKEGKSFSQFMVEAKINKDKMPCNKPKAQAVGDSETGKSHVVKACENGQEKIIRFGQRGVKGSPKKKGESEAYKNRRLRFQARHAKNIAKGKMSAAYWSNKFKW
jgi:hypothetical protein